MHVIGKSASPSLQRALSSPSLLREGASPMLRKMIFQRKGSLPIDNLAAPVRPPSSPFFSSEEKFSPSARGGSQSHHQRMSSAPGHLVSNLLSPQSPLERVPVVGGDGEPHPACHSDPTPRRHSPASAGVTPRNSPRKDEKNRSRPNSLHLPRKVPPGKVSRSSEGFLLENVGVINPSQAGSMNKLTQHLDEKKAVKSSSADHLVGLAKRGSAAQSSRRSKKKTSTASLPANSSSGGEVGCSYIYQQWCHSVACLYHNGVKEPDMYASVHEMTDLCGSITSVWNVRPVWLNAFSLFCARDWASGKFKFIFSVLQWRWSEVVPFFVVVVFSHLVVVVILFSFSFLFLSSELGFSGRHASCLRCVSDLLSCLKLYWSLVFHFFDLIILVKSFEREVRCGENLKERTGAPSHLQRCCDGHVNTFLPALSIFFLSFFLQPWTELYLITS